MKRDLKAVGARDGEWYTDAKESREWRGIWSHSLEECQEGQAAGKTVEQNVMCTACGAFQIKSTKIKTEKPRPHRLCSNLA